MQDKTQLPTRVRANVSSRSRAPRGRKLGVVLVEHDPGVAKLHSARLAEDGFEVVTVSSGHAIPEVLTRCGQFAVAVIDLDLPQVDGVDALARIRSEDANALTIVTTSNGSLSSAVDFMRAGAFDYLVKPISPDRLAAAVHAAIQTRNPEEPPQRASLPAGARMLGSSLSISRVLRKIQTAASSQAAVFITGESGTGKEVCAELIHQGGDRAGKPFIAFNCSAVPRELVESEIFGHVKGAFTGATVDRPGAAILAHGGTLFLDEICEMDISLQAKLLRFLQNGRVRRLGARSEEKVDTRIICATNRDPLNELRAGRFREDLYYRLHVIPIEVPPLRARGNDAVELAHDFVREYAAEEKKGKMRLLPCAELAIARYSWPGNIRQLQNMIRNAVVFNEDKELTAAAFPELTGPLLASASGAANEWNQTETPTQTPASDVHPEMTPGRTRTLAQIEREAIEQSMRVHNNNIARAAAMLNISPSTIYRKLQAWNRTFEAI